MKKYRIIGTNNPPGNHGREGFALLVSGLDGSFNLGDGLGYDGFQWQCQKGFKLWLRIEWF